MEDAVLGQPAHGAVLRVLPAHRAAQHHPVERQRARVVGDEQAAPFGGQVLDAVDLDAEVLLVEKVEEGEHLLLVDRVVAELVDLSQVSTRLRHSRRPAVCPVAEPHPPPLAQVEVGREELLGGVEHPIRLRGPRWCGPRGLRPRWACGSIARVVGALLARVLVDHAIEPLLQLADARDHEGIAGSLHGEHLARGRVGRMFSCRLTRLMDPARGRRLRGARDGRSVPSSRRSAADAPPSSESGPASTVVAVAPSRIEGGGTEVALGDLAFFGFFLRVMLRSPPGASRRAAAGRSRSRAAPRARCTRA